MRTDFHQRRWKEIL